MAQSEQGAHRGEKRVGIALLPGNRRCVVGRIDRQIQFFRLGGRKTEVFPARPLHGRARAGAGIAALLCGQLEIAHADLVAVIEEGHAGHGKEEGINELQLCFLQRFPEPDRVVVSGDQGDVAMPLRAVKQAQVVVEEAVDAAACVLFEIAVVFAGVVLVISQQGAVAVAAPVQIKVRVEARAQRLMRPSPFRDQHRLREFQIQHPADIAPDRARCALVRVVVFHEGVGHIDAEAVAAVTEPEAHHIQQIIAG